MRAVFSGLILVLVSTAASAQQPAAPSAGRTMVSAADVAALIAKAKVDRKDNQALLAQSMIRLAPYNVSLEYRAAVANAAVHETEAELFYVIDGSAMLVTGGRLKNETRTNEANLSGTGIEGGQSRHVAKGDFILVPEDQQHKNNQNNNTKKQKTQHQPHAPKPTTTP